MVNQEESQVKDEKDVSAGDTENDLGEGKDDRDPVGENDIEDSSGVSERLYQSDSFHLRGILPNELWYMIIDMLENSPEDWKNCVNASPYFWELQRDQRVVTLFPDVIDILAKRYEPREWLEVDEAELDQGQEEVDQGTGGDFDIFGDFGEEDVEEAADPENRDAKGKDESDEELDDLDGMEENEKRWKNAVLKCRLVCKSWNEAIENCYSRPDMSGIRDFKNDSDPRSPVNLMNDPWIGDKLQIGNPRETEQFVEHFSQSHHSGEKAPPKNPVLGRYMWIDTSRERFLGAERDLESVNLVTKVLKMFGKWLLWYTHINVSCWHMTDDQYYLKIREWLCLMPNLKYLQFEEVWSPAKASPAVIAANPMPKLENIQLIDVNYRCRASVISEVVRANAHVPQLKFWESRIDEGIGAVLSNLSAFSSNSLSSFDVEMMEKYGSSWKLNKANVDSYNGDFKGMFQILEKNWGNTLIDLTLCFYSCHNSMLEGSKNCRLNLPHIRRLRLEIQDYVLLDFILPLANTLEYLEIETYHPKGVFSKECAKRDAEEKDQTIQFAGFEDRMHQSNIWQIFKKLKTIKMELNRRWERFAVFTREGDKISYAHRELFTD